LLQDRLSSSLPICRLNQPHHLPPFRLLQLMWHIYF
jgi:hypothetical protein